MKTFTIVHNGKGRGPHLAEEPGLPRASERRVRPRRRVHVTAAVRSRLVVEVRCWPVPWHPGATARRCTLPSDHHRVRDVPHVGPCRRASTHSCRLGIAPVQLRPSNRSRIASPPGDRRCRTRQSGRPLVRLLVVTGGAKVGAARSWRHNSLPTNRKGIVLVAPLPTPTPPSRLPQARPRPPADQARERSLLSPHPARSKRCRGHHSPILRTCFQIRRLRWKHEPVQRGHPKTVADTSVLTGAGYRRFPLQAGPHCTQHVSRGPVLAARGRSRRFHILRWGGRTSRHAARTAAAAEADRERAHGPNIGFERNPSTGALVELPLGPNARLVPLAHLHGPRPALPGGSVPCCGRHRSACVQ